MMFGPKMLTSKEDQGRAASILVFYLVSGLAVGSALSSYIVGLLWKYDWLSSYLSNFKPDLQVLKK